MKKALNSNQIKLVAMTIDHLTWAFFPGTQPVWYVFALHVIGRLTAPIMWFFIAEGCHYTHDIKKYIGRLFMQRFTSCFWTGAMVYCRCSLSCRFQFWQDTMENAEDGEG